MTHVLQIYLLCCCLVVPLKAPFCETSKDCSHLSFDYVTIAIFTCFHDFTDIYIYLFPLCRFGISLGGSLLVAKLAWPNQWVLLIGAFCSTLGAALQCLTSKCINVVLTFLVFMVPIEINQNSWHS